MYSKGTYIDRHFFSSVYYIGSSLVALPFLIYVVIGVIALSLDKIEYHLGTIMTAYLYNNEIIIKSMIIGGGIIILANVIFYFFSMKEER